MIKTLTQIQTKVKIANKLKAELLSDMDEESQVIVHFTYKSNSFYEGLRVWKTTYLIPKESKRISTLVTVDNISMYPIYTYTPSGKTLKFTLIFSGLSKSCKTFDLIEQIPEPGGFIYKNIKRNKTDIYHIEL